MIYFRLYVGVYLVTYRNGNTRKKTPGRKGTPKWWNLFHLRATLIANTKVTDPTIIILKVSAHTLMRYGKIFVTTEATM